MSSWKKSLEFENVYFLFTFVYFLCTFFSDSLLSSFSKYVNLQETYGEHLSEDSVVLPCFIP